MGYPQIGVDRVLIELVGFSDWEVIHLIPQEIHGKSLGCVEEKVR